jgi:preprotein translocase subunit SecD
MISLLRILLALLTLAALVGPGAAAPLQAPGRFKFEIRRAEDTPGPGLVEATEERTGEKVYLYPEVIVTNTDIIEARAEKDDADEYYHVNLNLSNEAGARMAEVSGRHVGRPLAILINGKVVSVAIVISKMSDKGQISGQFDETKAQRIAQGLSGK